MEDREIIGQCQKGELKQFGLLYDKYAKKIYDFVYFKTWHKETAEDIVSQVFMKGLESVKKFDPDKGTFSAWLYAIARNTVIDYYRVKKADVNIEDVWDLGLPAGKAGEHVDLDSAIDARDTLEKVKKYLGKLEPTQREIVIMRVWQEMPYEEIAEALGKSAESCRMSFSRVMAKLRAEMPLLELIILFALWIFKKY
ncbi:RNA polymerase sigma factor [Patescibacteria group bacterium]|nr:MAG: RNA polymerase sigma factor [Patescibacteria group bacterium]